MARQIQTAFGPNVFSAYAAPNAFEVTSAIVVSDSTTGNIVSSSAATVSNRVSKTVVFSPVGVTRSLFQLNFAPNSFVSIQTTENEYSNSFGAVLQASDLSTTLGFTLANATALQQFAQLLALTADVVSQTAMYFSPQAVSTTFNTGATGLYFGSLANARTNHASSTATADTSDIFISFSLAPLFMMRFVSSAVAVVGTTYRKVESMASPNVFSNKFLTDIGALTTEPASTQRSQFYDGYMDTYDLLQDVKLILLTGPGEIDDEAVWRITRAEFEKFSAGRGYAFAKILILGRYTNPHVVRVFVTDPRRPEPIETERFLPGRRPVIGKTPELRWLGPTGFELKTGQMFSLDLAKYLAVQDIDNPEYDALVLDGVGYVMDNVFYFVPTQEGEFRTTLEVLELKSGAHLEVQLTLHVVSEAPQNTLAFLIPYEPGERFVLPVDLLLGQLEDMKIEVPSIDGLRLVDNVLIVRGIIDRPVDVRVYAGKKLYCVLQLRTK